MAYVGLLLAVMCDNALQVMAPGLLFTAPDLPLVTALYIGFRARGSGELGLAIVLGLFVDCFSARPLGHFAFLYGTGAYFALRLRRYVPPDALVSHIFASFICGVGVALLALLLAVITVHSHVGPGLWRALVEAGASALIAPFVFGLWDRSRFFRRALPGRSRYEFAR